MFVLKNINISLITESIIGILFIENTKIKRNNMHVFVNYFKYILIIKYIYDEDEVFYSS